MNEIIYQVGIPHEYINEAIALYEEAFGKKISVVIKEDSERRKVISSCFVLEYAISALASDRLVGIAGIHTKTGSLTGGMGYKELISQLGFIKGSKAALMFSLYERKPKEGELVMDGISVHSEYRGKGIGGMLLTKVKEYALRHGFSSIRLDVIDINPRAKALYERSGFKVVKQEEFYYLKNILGFGSSETMIFRVEKNA